MRGGAPMLAYIARRVLLILPTLLVVALAVFALVRLIPGDPAQVLLGEGADPALLETMRQDLGLDRPLPVQFARWLADVLRGDLGTSILTDEPVARLIFERFSLSAIVVLLAVGVASTFAVILGLIAAWRQGRVADFAINGVATLLLAVPAFWLGLLLLILFGIELQWLPVVGYVPFSQDFGVALTYIVLPVATLAIVETGVLT
ncbi:MAG: ABC transporter permease, partial [Burkholderiaceae bacterium]